LTGVAGNRVRVKICGITSPEDGVLAARVGADAVGLVFWDPSPRCVDRETARRVCGAVPPFVLRVGVFVDATREEIARTVDDVGLDLVQLHGHEPPEALSGLPRRALKAVGVGSSFSLEEVLRYEGHAAGVLLDARVEGGPPGGTGQTLDWTRAQLVRDRVSCLVLAGGLTSRNVGQAIEIVRPDAVDVSTGVESMPGRKDPGKLRAFLEAVRAVGDGPASPGWPR
jgi:phosphoribosylanthranilate isomerase